MSIRKKNGTEVNLPSDVTGDSNDETIFHINYY